MDAFNTNKENNKKEKKVMKRFFIGLLLVIGVSIGALAQSQMITVKKTEHNVGVSGSTLDRVDASGESVAYTFDISRKEAIQVYDIPVYLDSMDVDAATTTPYVSVYLAGSYDNENWTDIDTATFAATQADTAFNFTDLSTGVVYGYMRVKMAGADSLDVKVNKVYAKFLDK